MSLSSGAGFYSLIGQLNKGIRRLSDLSSRSALCCLFGALLLAGCSVYGPPYCPLQRERTPPPAQPAAEKAAGPLLQKALDYDRYLQETLLPRPHGGVVNAVFKNERLDQIIGYDDQQDSTIWTGIYLAAEAFRHAASTDPEEKAEALENARRTVETLHFFLEATESTGEPGYLPRFAAPLESKFLPQSIGDPSNCTAAHGCTPTPDGKTFWLGGTTRDQYTGWFFGMGIAHRLIPDLRPAIERDVETVITALQASKWVIGGKSAGRNSGAKVEPEMRLAWLLIAADVLRDQPEICQEIEKQVRSVWPVLGAVVEDEADWTNKYLQYYGFNLDFLNNYHLIRLEPNPRRRGLFLRAFQNGPYRHVRETGNVFFDYIAMAAGVTAPSGTEREDRNVLEQFPASPRISTCACPPEAELSRTSLVLYRLNKALSVFHVPMKVFPQAREPYPLSQRCADDFIWQQSPYVINCCCAASCQTWSKYQNASCQPAGKTPTSTVTVFPGVDYLAAYWMGRYHGFLGPED